MNPIIGLFLGIVAGKLLLGSPRAADNGSGAPDEETGDTADLTPPPKRSKRAARSAPVVPPPKGKKSTVQSAQSTEKEGAAAATEVGTDDRDVSEVELNLNT